MNDNKRKQKIPIKYWILLALVILFIGPIFVANTLYDGGNSWVTSRVNYGHLIQPPKSLQTLHLTQANGKKLQQKSLNGKWILLYVVPKRCDENCKKTLYTIHQIQIALGKYSDRVSRIFVTLSKQHNKILIKKISHHYPAMKHFVITKNSFLKLTAHLPNNKLMRQNGGIFIVDPLGNIMMSYQAQTKGDGIYQDLNRLLRVSQIG